MDCLRKCKDCSLEAHTEEDLDLFRIDYTMLFNRANLCKKCDNKRKEIGRNEDNRRNWYYKKHYGITLKDYNKMFIEQEGCCKICGIHQVEVDKRLAIDHNHTTGEVRGLLCDPCNKALGIFKDDIKLLENAINYLKDNK